METRSEMARLWLYGNHEISSKVKYYLILRYGTAEQSMEQSVPELEKELAKQFDVPWLYADFKKKGGYQRSIVLSHQYDLYRQDFCGCVFSAANRHAASH